MPGVGKSSVGKHMAKQLNIPFVDTDTIIEETLGISIDTYINEKSESKFLEIENQCIADYTFKSPSIIATGGSLVYGKQAMANLRDIGTVIWLKDSVQNILNRVKNIDERGIIFNQQKTLYDVFKHREPLYKRYSHHSIQIPNPFNLNQICSKIKAIL